MTAQIFIWLTENTAHTYQWGVAKQGAFTSMPMAALSEIAQHLQIDPNELCEVIILLPGNTVFSTVITVPDQQAKYLQQSLPFLVEESLTEDIADMYLLLGPKVNRNQYVVVGITRAKLEQTLRDLKASNIDPRMMIADHTCCPANSIILTADTSLLCLIKNQSQCVETNNVSDFLMHYVNQHEIATLEWLVDAQVQAYTAPTIQAVEENSATSNITFSKQIVSSPLKVLVQHYLQAPAYYQALNFLQGKYAQKTVRKTPLHRWRQVGLLVGTILMLYLSLNIAQGIYLKVKTVQLEKQSKQFYKELFPTDTVTDNVRAQMTGKLKAADNKSSKGAFLDTYSQVVTLIQKNQLQSTLDVSQVSFNDDSGEVHIDLLAKNIEQITQLKELLVKDGLKAEIGSTANEKDKTKASLKIWQ